MAVGSWNWYARLCSGFCCCLLGIVDLAAIIVIGVVRFNYFGQLAALSLTPSKYSEEPFKFNKAPKRLAGGLSDERTFEQDGKLILTLWVL